ncbi:hypothetical protein [Flavobacterium sp. ZB4P13]|uniref:hypothetical protein n=1 Tax=Flavobacterium sp. ZB4P13 TaxID=3401728 RepID=UPI003AAFBAFF
MTAPFLIKGTIEDINFVVTADRENYARRRGRKRITAEEFKNNPVFDRICNQGQEFALHSSTLKLTPECLPLNIDH